ncbi:MAG: peptidoglycan DD-metalloendopeptidase family protein [Actinobacteria bacterium]|nr:peptidoglycan DD-metalloendopeptidase family protein [Actinomycetota bacterium]
MSDQSNKFFTLLIISDAKSKIKRIRISHNFLRFFGIASIVVVASISILVSNLVLTHQKLNEKLLEIQRIEYKINYKEVELQNLEKKTKEVETKTKILENYLKEIEELDKMVRNITGKGGFDEEVAIYSSDLSADINIESDPSEIFYYTNDQEEELDDIDKLLDELLAKAPALSEKLSQDKRDMEDHIYLMEHTPSIWPTWGKITTLFCDGRAKTWRPGLHKGLDIANSVGTQVNATASGVVIFSGWHGGYGRKVVIYHGTGLDGAVYTTVYAHLNKIYVNVGDEVKQGDVIGLMGNSGRSTGSHLHYEVLVNGIPKNPRDFLP